jgi:hypothetical protein
MIRIGSQSQDQQENPSCADAIETAVPLSRENPLISSERANQKCQHETNSSTQTFARWNLHLGILGVIIGMLVTGIAYGALEILLVHFGEHQEPPSNSADAVEHVQYATLKFLSHLADLFYILICLGFAWIITLNGNDCTQRLLRSDIIPDERTDDARFIFVMVVYLDGGFLVGASFMGLIVEILLGVPFSLYGFGSAIALDIIVCCLLIRCYDWGLVTDPRQLNDEPSTSKQDVEQFYIQIV